MVEFKSLSMDYDGWDCEGHDLILGRHGED